MDENCNGACDSERPATFEERCGFYRKDAKAVENRVRALMDDVVFRGEQSFVNQHGEMKANIMLAVRHLEDARMRLGKAIQYAGDGVSVFDK